jgi:hypothetical protein
MLFFPANLFEDLAQLVRRADRDARPTLSPRAALTRNYSAKLQGRVSVSPRLSHSAVPKMRQGFCATAASAGAAPAFSQGALFLTHRLRPCLNISDHWRGPLIGL